MSLTDKSALAATEELSIKIKADKENNILHVTDTGIGMTKDDLVKNLGTIAKSGTSEFFQRMAVRFLRLFLVNYLCNNHLRLLQKDLSFKRVCA